jgi:CRISPR system Cascade subunit CasE
MVNTGENPDRPRPGRQWLRDIYHVHQRLSMAFPMRDLKNNDPYFLKPYDPCFFEKPRFLFRIERGIREDGPQSVILMQSDMKPDLNYAFQNAPGLLSYWQTRELRIAPLLGTRYRFRLLANPTKKQSMEGRNNSRRVALIGEELQRNWLNREGGKHGFTIDKVAIQRSGFKQGCKHEYMGSQGKTEHAIKLSVVQFDGFLTVTDANVFNDALRNGIGPGRAFGCGLLSVIPV